MDYKKKYLKYKLKYLTAKKLFNKKTFKGGEDTKKAKFLDLTDKTVGIDVNKEDKKCTFDNDIFECMFRAHPDYERQKCIHNDDFEGNSDDKQCKVRSEKDATGDCIFKDNEGCMLQEDKLSNRIKNFPKDQLDAKIGQLKELKQQYDDLHKQHPVYKNSIEQINKLITELNKAATEAEATETTAAATETEAEATETEAAASEKKISNHKEAEKIIRTAIIDASNNEDFYKKNHLHIINLVRFYICNFINRTYYKKVVKERTVEGSHYPAKFGQLSEENNSKWVNGKTANDFKTLMETGMIKTDTGEKVFFNNPQTVWHQKNSESAKIPLTCRGISTESITIAQVNEAIKAVNKATEGKLKLISDEFEYGKAATIPTETTAAASVEQLRILNENLNKKMAHLKEKYESEDSTKSNYHPFESEKDKRTHFEVLEKWAGKPGDDGKYNWDLLIKATKKAATPVEGNKQRNNILKHLGCDVYPIDKEALKKKFPKLEGEKEAEYKERIDKEYNKNIEIHEVFKAEEAKEREKRFYTMNYHDINHDIGEPNINKLKICPHHYNFSDTTDSWAWNTDVKDDYEKAEGNLE